MARTDRIRQAAAARLVTASFLPPMPGSRTGCGRPTAAVAAEDVDWVSGVSSRSSAALRDQISHLRSAVEDLKGRPRQ